MEDVLNFLQQMPFWYWWVLAAGLLLLEVMTGSSYLLWPAGAAILTGLLSLMPFDPNWQIELLFFAITTGLLLYFAAPRIKTWMHRTRQDHDLLNERGARKVGRRVVVDTGLVNGRGQVRLDDTLWLAETENGKDYPAGARLKIVATEGTKLILSDEEAANVS